MTPCPNMTYYVFFMQVDPKNGLSPSFDNFLVANVLVKDWLYANFDNVSFYSNLVSLDNRCRNGPSKVNSFSVPIYREPRQHRGFL